MACAAATHAEPQVEGSPRVGAELADSSAAAQYIAEGCLADGPLRRIGLEVEAHCHDPADPHRRPSWEEIREVAESLPGLPCGSRLTVEPGGAVELSGPPADGVVAAIDAMRRDQAVLRSAFAGAGLGLVGFRRRRAGAGLPGR